MRLLRSKKKLPWYKDIKTIIVPKKGWWRLLNYFWHRIGRLTASPYSIAAGLACGAAISFTPFLGLQIIIAIAFASVIRGNLIAAVIGTFVASPWTIPFILLAIYHSGIFLLGTATNQTAPLDVLNEGSGAWDLLTSMFMNMDELFVPMLVGSVPFVIVTWIGTFTLCYFSINKYKAKMAERRKKKK